MPNFYIDNWWLISCPFSPEYPILYLLYPYPYDNMWLLIWLTLNLLLKRRRFHINFNFKLSFKVKHKKTIIFIQFDVLYRSLIWKPCSKQPMNVERNKNLHTHTHTTYTWVDRWVRDKSDRWRWYHREAFFLDIYVRFQAATHIFLIDGMALTFVESKQQLGIWKHNGKQWISCTDQALWKNNDDQGHINNVW